jgi:hypothetical protein
MWWHLLSCGVYSYDSVLSRFEHDKPHHLMNSNRLHHSKPCSNHIIEPHHNHLTSRRMEDQYSQYSTSQTQHHQDGKTCTTLKAARLSNTTNHKNPILKYDALVQLMHATSVYWREKAYWNKMVKGHLPCSSASCCSKSWKSSS